MASECSQNGTLLSLAHNPSFKFKHETDIRNENDDSHFPVFGMSEKDLIGIETFLKVLFSGNCIKQTKQEKKTLLLV